MLYVQITEAVLQLRDLDETEIEVDSCGDYEGWLLNERMFLKLLGKLNKSILIQQITKLACIL